MNEIMKERSRIIKANKYEYKGEGMMEEEFKS